VAPHSCRALCQAWDQRLHEPSTATPSAADVQLLQTRPDGTPWPMHRRGGRQRRRAYLPEFVPVRYDGQPHARSRICLSEQSCVRRLLDQGGGRTVLPVHRYRTASPPLNLARVFVPFGIGHAGGIPLHGSTRSRSAPPTTWPSVDVHIAAASPPAHGRPTSAAPRGHDPPRTPRSRRVSRGRTWRVVRPSLADTAQPRSGRAESMTPIDVSALK
jgi:hypothetical protein